MQVEIEHTHTWKKRKNNKQLTEVIWQRNKRLDKLKQPNVNLKISSRNTILKLIFFFFLSEAQYHLSKKFCRGRWTTFHAEQQLIYLNLLPEFPYKSFNFKAILRISKMKPRV